MRTSNTLIIVIEKDCQETERFDESVFDLIDQLKKTPNRGAAGRIELKNGAILTWSAQEWLLK